MLNCDEVIQLLTDYIDGELESDAQALLDSHFKACPSCVRFLETFRFTIERTGEFRCEDIPEEVSRKLHDFLSRRIQSTE
jgi:anti-sigma factor RsiW